MGDGVPAPSPGRGRTAGFGSVGGFDGTEGRATGLGVTGRARPAESVRWTMEGRGLVCGVDCGDGSGDTRGGDTTPTAAGRSKSRVI